MSCQDVKAITLRPGVCRFKAEIQFNPTTLANKDLDGHPDNLPGIKASFTRALHHSRTPPSASRPSPSSLPPPASLPSGISIHDDDGGGHGGGGAGAGAGAGGSSVYDGMAGGGLSAEEPALRRELHRYSRMLLLTLALEVDRLEQDIRKRHPEFRYIDLEVL
jgi:hypothetical protein